MMSVKKHFLIVVASVLTTLFGQAQGPTQTATDGVRQAH